MDICKNLDFFRVLPILGSEEGELWRSSKDLDLTPFETFVKLMVYYLSEWYNSNVTVPHNLIRHAIESHASPRLTA
jgi:hypothetical protein